MKIISLLNKFLIVICLTVSANSFAGTLWEVSVLFLGKDEDTFFQKDIQNNIKEIQKIKLNSDLKISIFNETNKHSVNDIETFIKKSFSNKQSKKALIIYSHGLGSQGLKNYSTLELKNILKNSKLTFDMMWFDACFMANLEFLFEMRHFSQLTIASEDAEFSSGLPFESLENLPQFANEKDAARMLAKDFITSYSYLKNGKQKENVQSSSSTISIIENKNLGSIVLDLKKIKTIYQKLPVNIQNDILTKVQKNFLMDNPDLMDLGRFLIELRSKTNNKNDDSVITALIRKLNIESIRSLKTNPRIKIKNPSEVDTIMVYGLNNWTRGDEKDYKENGEILNGLLQPDGFIAGEKGKMWPYKRIKKEILLTPFAPNINSFNYFFLSIDAKKIIENPKSIDRSLDAIWNESKNSESPILGFGYTQEVGKSAERYTGINIMKPNSVPDMDYAEFEFFSIVEWLSL